MSNEAAASAQAHGRLIDVVVAKYWSMPSKGRGDFVVGVVNLYIHELATRRPDFSSRERDELTVAFARALVKKIDYPNGNPLLRRLLAECQPAGRA
jgi:hypothetical protein